MTPPPPKLPKFATHAYATDAPVLCKVKQQENHQHNNPRLA